MVTVQESIGRRFKHLGKEHRNTKGILEKAKGWRREIAERYTRNKYKKFLRIGGDMNNALSLMKLSVWEFYEMVEALSEETKRKEKIPKG